MTREEEITALLAQYVSERRGAFAFPEFLTSFEEGGRSAFDFDAPGEVAALEGYFRITRIEGTRIEAEEMISETRVWPIIFPHEVAARLINGLIINLEIIRTADGWQITDCGLAYPPGTEF